MDSHSQLVEESTEYRGYTNPNVQSRSFKIIQQSLSIEEAEEGTFVPSGVIPGEMIVVRAYNEGKRRMAEMSETHPRNFASEGKPQHKSPNRNLKQYYGIEDDERMFEKYQEPEEGITTPSTVVSAKNFQGVESAPRKRPPVEKSTVQPQYKLVTDGVQVTDSILSPNIQSRPIVVTNTVNNRPLKMVNYNLPEQPNSPPVRGPAASQVPKPVQQPANVMQIERAPALVAPGIVMAPQVESKVISSTSVQMTRPVNENALVEKPVQIQETKTVSITTKSTANQTVQKEIKTDKTSETVQLSERMETKEESKTVLQQAHTSEKSAEDASLLAQNKDKENITETKRSSEGNSSVEMVAKVPGMEPSPVIQAPPVKILKPSPHVQAEPNLTDQARSSPVRVEETALSPNQTSLETGISEILEPSSEAAGLSRDLTVEKMSEDSVVETSTVKSVSASSVESVQIADTAKETTDAEPVSSQSTEINVTSSEKQTVNLNETVSENKAPLNEPLMEPEQVDKYVIQTVDTESSEKVDTTVGTGTSTEAVRAVQSNEAGSAVSVDADSQKEILDVRSDITDVTISNETKTETVTTENVALIIENDSHESVTVSADTAEFTTGTSIAITNEVDNSVSADTAEFTTDTSIAITNEVDNSVSADAAEFTIDTPDISVTNEIENSISADAAEFTIDTSDISVANEIENSISTDAAEFTIDTSDISVANEIENSVSADAAEFTINTLNISAANEDENSVSVDAAEFTIDTSNISVTNEVDKSATVDTAMADVSLSLSEDTINVEAVTDVSLSDDNVTNIVVGFTEESSEAQAIQPDAAATVDFSISLHEESTINTHEQSPEKVSEETAVKKASNKEDVGDSKQKAEETKVETTKNNASSVGKKSPPRTNKAKFIDSQGGIQARLQRLKQKK